MVLCRAGLTTADTDLAALRPALATQEFFPESRVPGAPLLSLLGALCPKSPAVREGMDVRSR